MVYVTAILVYVTTILMFVTTILVYVAILDNDRNRFGDLFQVERIYKDTRSRRCVR